MAEPQGALAAVTDVEEEVVTPDAAIDVTDIVERTTSTGAGQSLTSMILQQKQNALDRLAQGRERITASRAEQAKRDESSKWLALAQGMLSSGPTGSFGEGMGRSAGLLRQESELRSQHAAEFDQQLNENAAQEMAAESEMIDQLLKMTGQSNANAAKGVHGSIQTMVHPEDIKKGIAQQRLVFGSMQLNDSGEWAMKPLADDGGTLFLAADRLEPARAAAIIKAAETADDQQGRSTDFIADAYGVQRGIQNARRALEIFETAEVDINTSGVTAWKQGAQEFLNVDFGDKTELAELQNIIAQDYLDKLEALKGNTSDRDVQIMQGISLGLGRDTDANYITLQKMVAHYETLLVRGIRSAYQESPRDVNGVADLWPSVAGNVWVPGARPVGKLDAATYEKLEPGASVFLQGDWGGKIYTKPKE